MPGIAMGIQDPPGLAAADNLYELASNFFKYVDPLGLRCVRVVDQGNRRIIEIVDKFAPGTREARHLADFVKAWNRVIANNSGQLTRRQRPLSAREEEYAKSWREKMRRENPSTYRNRVVGHVPDAIMGGPVAWNRWGGAVGETMPLYKDVNSYLGGLTGGVQEGITYHEVRLVSVSAWL